MRRTLNWLTSNRILAIILLSIFAWFSAKLGMKLHTSTPWLVAAIYGVAVVGLVSKRKWALWLGALLIALCAFDAGKELLTSGWTWRGVLKTAGLAVLAWSLVNSPDSGLLDEPEKEDADDVNKGEPLISLVHLRSSRRYLEPVVLANALSDAWGLDITYGDDEQRLESANGFVVGEDSTYIVWVKTPTPICFLVHNREDPYWRDADELADEVSNLRFAEIIRGHSAWLAVDLLDRASAKTASDEAYRLIGKAMAALADSDTLALFCPQQNSFNLWSDDLAHILCGDDPLGFFREEVKAPIINLQHDQSLEACIAEARRRWPEFVSAYKAKAASEVPFIVKAAFTHEGNTEHMWITVYGIEPEYVHGHLVNEPFHHPHLKKGALVEVPVTDVSDWIFMAPDGSPVGNFTGAAVNEAQRGKTKGKGS